MLLLCYLLQCSSQYYNIIIFFCFVLNNYCGYRSESPTHHCASLAILLSIPEDECVIICANWTMRKSLGTRLI